MEAYEKTFKKEEVYLLKRLAERYHALPLNREELAEICRNTRIDLEKVQEVLSKAVEKGILEYVVFRGRRIVYLDRIGQIKRKGIHGRR